MTAPHADPPDALGHETLGDRQVRELIERYVALTGTTLEELGPHLYELVIPPEDRTIFDRRSSVRLAFSVEAVQADAEAEMAIVGGGFVERLISAVRGRGARYRAGRLGALTADAAQHATLPAAVRRGSAGEPESSFALHRVARLTARVVIRAGTTLEEHLVDSGVFDMVTGMPMGPDVAAECERQLVAPSVQVESRSIPMEASQPAGALVKRMLGDLEESLAPQLEKLRQKAEQELAHEGRRIRQYYQSLLEDAGGRGTSVPDRESRRVFEAERDRRLAEEDDRHLVRASVHPVQLTEWEVLVQRAQWALQGADGHHGTVTAQRVLAGEQRWLAGCPSCGAGAPDEFAVCIHDHAACSGCAQDCSACGSAFCRDHGSGLCHVDERPACDAHGSTCVSCLRIHCRDHTGECDDGAHPACTSCIGACASCGRRICDRHAESSNEDAPRGARRFCSMCVRRCEGGSNELVGPDEVTGCATCDRVVCEHHQARCTVDGKVHCSTHLRRTDRSRRLVCEADRASCAYEPTAVFATDEVAACITCGRLACDAHAAPCAEDLAIHCRTHMAELGDRRGELACEAHRTTCHVDGAAFSLTGTRECPVCTRAACQKHVRGCAVCGRNVCVADLGDGGLCTTCAVLTEIGDPSDLMIQVANTVFGGAGKARRWRSARDARHLVVEADLGWTRKAVFVVRHGHDKAEKAYVRSVLGTRVVV